MCLLVLTALLLVYEANTVAGVAALASGFGFVLGRRHCAQRGEAWPAAREHATAARDSR